jgi:hypothetical protein
MNMIFAAGHNGERVVVSDMVGPSLPSTVSFLLSIILAASAGALIMDLPGTVWWRSINRVQRLTFPSVAVNREGIRRPSASADDPRRRVDVRPVGMCQP